MVCRQAVCDKCLIASHMYKKHAVHGSSSSSCTVFVYWFALGPSVYILLEASDVCRCGQGLSTTMVCIQAAVQLAVVSVWTEKAILHLHGQIAKTWFCADGDKNLLCKLHEQEGTNTLGGLAVLCALDVPACAAVLQFDHSLLALVWQHAWTSG